MRLFDWRWGLAAQVGCRLAKSSLLGSILDLKEITPPPPKKVIRCEMLEVDRYKAPAPHAGKVFYTLAQ